MPDPQKDLSVGVTPDGVRSPGFGHEEPGLSRFPYGASPGAGRLASAVHPPDLPHQPPPVLAGPAPPSIDPSR
jgi:hypothetical protein